MKTRIFKEGDFYRWEITTEDGKKYVDGGNFQTKEQARESLRDAVESLAETF